MMNTPERVNEPRRFSWVLLLFLLSGLVMSAVFILLSFTELRSPQNELGVVPSAAAVTETAIPASISTSAFTTLPLTDPRAGDTQGQGQVQVGQPAPDFTLQTLDGGQVALSAFRGQGVLINFWASWCPPCRVEMHDLVRAYEIYKDAGFVILGVDLTFQDRIEDVQAFVEEFDMTFPVLLDETGVVTEDLYQLLGLPMSVFVDREGFITRIHIGAMTGAQIDEFIREILE